MTPDNIFTVLRRLDEIKRDVMEVKELAKETNGRVKDIELWRARFQGALGTTRVLWMVGGGVVTGVIIGIAKGG